MANAEWVKIMVKVQEGDQSAYRKLLTEITPEIKRYCLKRISSKEQVDDLCQTVLMKIHISRHTYDPKLPFEPWFYAVIRSVIADFFKKSAKDSNTVYGVEHLEEMTADESDTDEALSVREAFLSLKEKERKILECLKLEGLSIVEAAKVLGISPGAAKVRSHRAVQAFKKAIEKRT